MESGEIDYEKKQEDLLEQYIENGNNHILRKILNFTPGKKKIKPIVCNRKINTHCFKPVHFLSSNTLIFKELSQKENLRNYDLYYDPKYKDKQMKGNTKWATQKFNLMRINMAKRYSTPIDAIQFRKIEQSKGKSQIINGNLIMQSNITEKRSHQLQPIKTKTKKTETKGKEMAKDNTDMPILHTNTCLF